MSASGIRSAIYRGELVPDGRGARNQALFLEETLDLFLKRRAERYHAQRRAVPGRERNRHESKKRHQDPLSGGRTTDTDHRLKAMGSAVDSSRLKRVAQCRLSTR